MATREDSSESVDEEQEVVPQVSQENTPQAPRNVTNPIPLFGIPPKAPVVSFRTFDNANVRESVSFARPRQPASPMQDAGKPTEGLFVGKADAAAKGKFLDPMVGSPPASMDFMVFVSGKDVSLWTNR